MKTNRTPLRKAFDESRFIILGAVLVAIAFNHFSDSSVAWIRRPPGTGDTTSLAELLGDTAAPVAPIDTVTNAIDTAAVVDSIPAIDTTGLSAQERAKAIEDSTRTAKAQRDAFVRDSIAKARAATPTAEPAIGDEVGTATAKQIYDRKAAVWFDARNADEFKEGHIPGAHHVYAGDFQQHIPRILQMGMKKDQLIVVYCGGGLCELSHDLAKNMRLLGFSKVVVYTGGTTDWTANNYPMTKGE
jgi:rhodanese-related sulfurtransferase